MTLYLRPTSFTSSRTTKLNEGEVFFIKILVDKIERRIYKVGSQQLHLIRFNDHEPFIGLSSGQYVIEVKLYKQDRFHSLNLIASAHVQKESIVRGKSLDSQPSHTPVAYQIELDTLPQSKTSKIGKMTREMQGFKIQLEIKLDKYKKVVSRIKSNMQFIEDLRCLDEDLQRESVNIISRPRPSVVDKNQLLPNQSESKKKEQVDSVNQSRVTANYIGSCYSKNIFSFLDKDQSSHIYSVVEPQYHH